MACDNSNEENFFNVRFSKEYIDGLFVGLWSDWKDDEMLFSLWYSLFYSFAVLFRWKMYVFHYTE